MTTENNTLLTVLQSRERRAKHQAELIEQYQASLVSFTLNIPGTQKDSGIFRKIHGIGMMALQNAIHDRANILFEEVKFSATGAEGYICVNMDAVELKHLTIGLETTHALGRIFDFDVFNDQYQQISRTDIGYHDRTCLLCSKNVHVCRREKNHAIEELLDKINSMAAAYLGEGSSLLQSD